MCKYEWILCLARGNKPFGGKGANLGERSGLTGVQVPEGIDQEITSS